MLSDFTFDVDDPHAFVDEWMAQVGDLHRGHKYTGWAFFDDEGRALDMRVTDRDGEWVDMGFDPEAHENGGWDFVLGHAREIGATNVISVHTHLRSEGDRPAPCDGLVANMGQGGLFLHNEGDGIELRGCALLFDDRLAGMVWIRGTSDPAEAGLYGPYPGHPDPVRDPVGYMLGDEPRDLLVQMRAMAAAGDANAIEMVPIMERITAALQAGGTPAISDLDRAIELTLDALNKIDSPEPKRGGLLGLPPFNPARMNRGMLN